MTATEWDVYFLVAFYFMVPAGTKRTRSLSFYVVTDGLS